MSSSNISRSESTYSNGPANSRSTPNVSVRQTGRAIDLASIADAPFSRVARVVTQATSAPMPQDRGAQSSNHGGRDQPRIRYRHEASEKYTTELQQVLADEQAGNARTDREIDVASIDDAPIATQATCQRPTPTGIDLVAKMCFPRVGTKLATTMFLKLPEERQQALLRSVGVCSHPELRQLAEQSRKRTMEGQFHGTKIKDKQLRETKQKFEEFAIMDQVGCVVERHCRKKPQAQRALSECVRMNSKTKEGEIIEGFRTDLTRGLVVRVKIKDRTVQVPKHDPYRFLKNSGFTREQALWICKHAHQGFYNDALDLWLEGVDLAPGENPSVTRLMQLEVDQNGHLFLESDYHAIFRSPENPLQQFLDPVGLILRCKASTQNGELHVEAARSDLCLPRSTAKFKDDTDQPPSPSDADTGSTGSTEPVTTRTAGQTGTDSASPARSQSPEDIGSTGSTEPVTARSPSPEETGSGSTEPVNT